MTSHEVAPYRGRFAPSPTGPLHFGSLLAACASYLEARVNRGQWLLRIEDIDPPREQPGADTLIIRALDAFGFEWHGPIVYQSTRADRHRELVDRLLAAGHAYPCSCTRRDLAAARRGPLGAVYPGTCRAGSRGGRVSIRVRTNNRPVSFNDGLQGPRVHELERESGDFVVRRRDGLIAYQLAVVADDQDQAISAVVRGIDLIDSTPRHLHLQRLLGFDTPRYSHIPVAQNRDGQKLGKTTGTPGLSLRCVRQSLVAAFSALGHAPPAELHDASIRELWTWGIAHWDIARLKGRTAIPASEYPLAEAQNGLS
ncbi:MAG: tRNA glutamyl-Q(34) synthetase GluQRS [Woeseiaceae bacterium]